jgi:hypothetical protein
MHNFRGLRVEKRTQNEAHEYIAVCWISCSLRTEKNERILPRFIYEVAGMYVEHFDAVARFAVIAWDIVLVQRAQGNESTHAWAVNLMRFPKHLKFY